jgi:hypothetical protein
MAWQRTNVSNAMWKASFSSRFIGVTSAQERQRHFCGMSRRINDLQKSFISDLTFPQCLGAERSLTHGVTQMTQKDQILARLQKGTWFSTVECVRDFHILRLGARIWDLRAEGYQIEERRVEGKAFSEYRLRPARPITLPPAFKPKPEVKTQTLF